MKSCFKCGERKPLSGFYAHSMMRDGYLGKCKDCTRKDVKEYRLKNIDKVREYDRIRAQLPHRIALRKRVLKEWTKANPDKAREQTRRTRAKNKAMGPAQTRAERHHRKAPDACQMCGLVKNRLERHHPDYALPLLIVWLCKPCHAIADKVRRDLESTGHLTCTAR